MLAAMKVGVVRESKPGERRVALIPQTLAALGKAGLDVVVEAGAGAEAGFLDAAFEEKGATIAPRSDVLGSAEVLCTVNGPAPGELRSGQTVIGFFDPLSKPGDIQALADAGVTALSMELIPRITRAQVMDALSSQANIAGYKAVVMAAETLPRMFPMFMTAAGTVQPAKVFVIGAGVAGLQAIATAKRLGAKVEAYDVRPAVAEQVESLGGKFVELDLDTGGAEDKGGYAKAQGEEFYKRQRELMAEVVARNDVCITTAAIPGRKSPLLVIEDAVKRMAPGSVIVDMASERGGNCELTKHGETIVAHDVTILGPDNLPSTVPYHASQMYSKNISSLLLHLVEDGALKFDTEDEITAGTLLCRDGAVVHERVKGLLAPKGE